MPDLLHSLQSHRSLSILVIYLSTCAGLAGFLCLNVYRRYKLRQHQPAWQARYSRQFALFLILAALSLAVTWYHMFSFFAHSYHAWEAARPDAQRATIAAEPFLSRCELWLRDTKLFREAWESVSESAERSWWSGQIFLWTAGWSLFLGVMGRRYNCPHVWTYMLLGQIVAISFALNLFAATLLASPLQHTKKQPDSGSSAPPLPLELAPVIISLLSALFVPYVVDTPYFLPILMIPHLLLFVPGILPRGLWTTTTKAKTYAYIFTCLAAVAVVIHARSTYEVSLDADGIADLARRLLAVMHEHPAVSSVAWDAVFCGTSVALWVVLRGGVENALEM